MAHDPFDVRLTRQAEKDIRDLHPWVDRILRALQSLEQDPTGVTHCVGVLLACDR